MSPIKILDDFYVFGILNGTKEEMMGFKRLPESDKIELLVSKLPIPKKIKISQSDKLFYSPALDRFIISDNKSSHLEYLSQHYAQIKAKKLFSILKEEYLAMYYTYYKLLNFIYSKNTL